MTNPSKHEIWLQRRERKRNINAMLFALVFVAFCIGGGLLLSAGMHAVFGTPYITIETKEGNAYVYGPGRFELEK